MKLLSSVWTNIHHVTYLNYPVLNILTISMIHNSLKSVGTFDTSYKAIWKMHEDRTVTKFESRLFRFNLNILLDAFIDYEGWINQFCSKCFLVLLWLVCLGSKCTNLCLHNINHTYILLIDYVLHDLFNTLAHVITFHIQIQNMKSLC